MRQLCFGPRIPHGRFLVKDAGFRDEAVWALGYQSLAVWW